MPSSISVASCSSSPSSSESCESNANVAAATEDVESDEGEEHSDEEEEEEVDDEAKDEDSKRHHAHDQGRQHRRDEETDDFATGSGRQTESVDNLDELELLQKSQRDHNLSVDAELLNPPSRPNSSRGGSISGLGNAATVPDPESRPEDDFPGAVLDAAESQQLIQELVDFAVGDGEKSVSIGELRLVLDEQIGRARRRMRGIEQINELLREAIQCH